MDIKGHTVKTVADRRAPGIAEEYHFSILLDRANRTHLAMCSKEGGMDVEQLAVEAGLRRSPRSPWTPTSASTRPRPREIVDAAGFSGRRDRRQDRALSLE